MPLCRCLGHIHPGNPSRTVPVRIGLIKLHAFLLREEERAEVAEAEAAAARVLAVRCCMQHAAFFTQLKICHKRGGRGGAGAGSRQLHSKLKIFRKTYRVSSRFVPTSSALIVTLFAHLKDTDTHTLTDTHTQAELQLQSATDKPAAAPLEHAHPRAARCSLRAASTWVVSNNFAAHLQSRLQLGSSSSSNLNMHRERTSSEQAATSGSIACNTDKAEESEESTLAQPQPPPQPLPLRHPN